MSQRPVRKPRPKLEHVVPIRRRERVRLEPLEPATWRLVVTESHDGATNMAIDAALAQSVQNGESAPLLRFYTWQPPCLSLGYAQSADVVDFDSCARHGWDVVRRTTGGRAVLHIDELTYSICAPEEEPRVRGGVLDSYRRLSAGLLRGLKVMGLEPERAQAYYGDLGEAGPACFDGPSDYEITIGQRKLIGSAQRRQRGVVLQHGSLPLSGDITRICDALALDLGKRMALRNRLHYRATTLASALGQDALDSAEIARALASGFEQALNLTFEPTSLSDAEWALASKLRAERYANDAWTRRR